MHWIRSHLSFANLVSLMALFVALGGTTYAAVTLPNNSVGIKQIKTNAVGISEIRKNAVRSGEVKNGSLRRGDFAAGQLPAGAKGDKGDQGIQGIQGVQGVQGEDAVALDAFARVGFDVQTRRHARAERCRPGPPEQGNRAGQRGSGRGSGCYRHHLLQPGVPAGERAGGARQR